MRPISVTVGPLASGSATAIATAQTPAGAADLTLNGALVVGGVAILDTPRRVLITAVSNESAKTLTVYGTDWNNNPVSETITGPNATTAQSVYDYKTVTRVAASAAFTGNVSVGTNGVASSRPIFLDPWAGAQVALQVTVTGTVNATVQQTLNDLQSSYTGASWVNHSDAAMVGTTTTVQSNYGYAPPFVRILLNSGSGSVVLTASQALGPVR